MSVGTIHQRTQCPCFIWNYDWISGVQFIFIISVYEPAGQQRGIKCTWIIICGYRLSSFYCLPSCQVHGSIKLLQTFAQLDYLIIAIRSSEGHRIIISQQIAHRHSNLSDYIFDKFNISGSCLRTRQPFCGLTETLVTTDGHDCDTTDVHGA